VTKDFYDFRKFLDQEAQRCVDHRTLLTELGGFKK
jgi:hypothetical protein